MAPNSRRQDGEAIGQFKNKLAQQRRRRWWIVALVVLAGASWASSRLYDDYQVRRAQIVRAMFAPALGPDSVILIHKAPSGESESLVEAVDMKTGQRHWQAWIEAISTSSYQARDVEVGRRVFGLGDRDHWPDHRVRIAVHRLKDGALPWKKHFPSTSEWAMHARIWLHKELL